MKNSVHQQTLLTTVALLLACGMLYAQRGGGQRDGNQRRGRPRGQDEQVDRDGRRGGVEGEQRQGADEFRAFRRQQMEERRQHMAQQQKEDQAFREGVRDQEPQAACQSIIEHRNQQHAQNKTFAEKQHGELIRFVKEQMVANEVPEDVQKTRLARMDQHFKTMTERFEERHAAFIETMKKLAEKDDLTWEDIRQALRRGGNRPGRGLRGQGEGQDESDRRGRGPRQGQGRGRRNGPAEE